MFLRDNKPIMGFRVYDSWGTCISEFTGTLEEWQTEVAPTLITKPDKNDRAKHLKLVE